MPDARAGAPTTTILVWTAAGPVIVYLGLIFLIGLIAWRTHVRGDVERNLRILEILIRVLPWRGGLDQAKAPVRARRARTRKGAR
ncbi:hypothetical protein [Actinomadura gamaensis]|uniref:Uncharacterized protein n=1 Tax=Actinomadura gamaensis TaxID=1763541 RepID=A0ABV9U5T4_9ACTN